MRLLMIGCGVLLRELSDAIVHSPHMVDAVYLPTGLHDTGATLMREGIQKAIDDNEGKKYDAIVLGYALCGTGLAGVRARSVQLVIPRAHDCIALLMGSREKYKNYFNSNPGTYYRSIGWVERDDQLVEQVAGIGLDCNLATMIEKYGEDNGRFLYEEMSGYKRNYSRLTFIRTGLEVDDSFRKRAQAEAVEKGWKFEEFDGSTTLFHRLLAGKWDEEFLLVPPGHQIVSSNDDWILAEVAVDEPAS
jgi:hypothetical protein